MEQEKLNNQKETLAFLQKKYPACFFAEGAVKPLKIGIFQDLVSDLAGTEIVSNRLLRASLRHYTSSWRYLAAIKTGQARVNLAGEEGDLVEAQHADHAAEQLKESKERAAAIREKNKANQVAKPSTHRAKASTKAHKANSDSSPDQKNRDTKHGADNSSKNTSRTQATKKRQTHKQKARKPEIEVKVTTPIADTELVVGGAALVKLGKEPMPVVITDINKDDIAVQLNSGMTVRVKQAQLYSPLPK